MNCVFFKGTILIQARNGQSYSQTALICTHFEQLGYFHMEAKRLPLCGGTNTSVILKLFNGPRKSRIPSKNQNKSRLIERQKLFNHLLYWGVGLIPLGRKCKKEEDHDGWENNHLADINQTSYLLVLG